MKLLCKIFGHSPTLIRTDRCYAECKRCNIGLKVSYDMAYGYTMVVGDYGNQTTFCWCDCGNELCSTSFVSDTDIVLYKCTRCGKESRWLFDAPCPIKL